MVIQQGSLIDRIDFNIEEAHEHIENGLGHLRNVEEKVDSPCARRTMCFLILGILALAIVIGFKLSKWF